MWGETRAGMSPDEFLAAYPQAVDAGEELRESTESTAYYVLDSVEFQGGSFKGRFFFKEDGLETVSLSFNSSDAQEVAAMSLRLLNSFIAMHGRPPGQEKLESPFVTSHIFTWEVEGVEVELGHMAAGRVHGVDLRYVDKRRESGGEQETSPNDSLKRTDQSLRD